MHRESAYQSAKSTKAKNPCNAVLAIECAGVRRIIVGFGIREPEYRTGRHCGLRERCQILNKEH
jgi:hypothetical protein